MTETDPLQLLLRAERAVRPPLVSVERGWLRLASDLAAHAAPLPIASGPLKLVNWWLVPKWILAGFSVGLVGAGTLVVGSLSPGHALVEQRTPALPQRHAKASARAPSSALSTVPEEGPPPERAPRPLLQSPASTPASSSASSATVAPFDAELQLIARAKAALDARKPSEAKRLLSEHAQQFPHGVFVTEREALEVQALCAEQPQNSALAEHFAALHPTSPLIPRLWRACNHRSLASTNENVEPRESTTESTGGK